MKFKETTAVYFIYFQGVDGVWNQKLYFFFKFHEKNWEFEETDDSGKFIQRQSIKIKLSIGKDKWARSVRIYTSRNRQNRHNVFVHVVKHLI